MEIKFANPLHNAYGRLRTTFLRSWVWNGPLKSGPQKHVWDPFIALASRVDQEGSIVATRGAQASRLTDILISL